MATGIVIVEDHDIYREGLKTLLATVPELELLGEAATAEDALGLVHTRRPDLVLMDVKLPGMSGIEATRLLTQADPEVRVLILSMFDDDPSVFAAMQAEARGYILQRGYRRADGALLCQTRARSGPRFQRAHRTQTRGLGLARAAANYGRDRAATRCTAQNSAQPYQHHRLEVAGFGSGGSGAAGAGAGAVTGLRSSVMRVE